MANNTNTSKKVMGTDGKTMVRVIERSYRNRREMLADGWTDEEIEATRKLAPRDGRYSMNGIKYHGLYALFTDAERLEETERQHKKGAKTIVKEVARKYNKTLIGVCMKLDTKLWDTVLDGADETTIKVASVLKSLKNAKAPQNVVDEFLALFE